MADGVVVTRNESDEVPRLALQEVREGVDRELAAVARRRIPTDVEVLDVTARLHRVRAAHYREVVRELVQVLEEAARRVAVGAEALGEAADVEVADDLARNEGEALEPVGGRGGLARRRAVEGVAEVVHYVAREDSGLGKREELLEVRPRIREGGEGLGVDEGDARIVLCVACEERVAFRQAVVAPHVVCVQVRGLLELAREERRLAGRVRRVRAGRQRYDGEIGEHRRVDRRASRQEGPGARGHARDGLNVGDSQALAEPLVCAEDEQPVLDDGAAEGEAELVALEGGFRRPRGVLEEVGGVERAVAQELEDSSVKLVRPRTRGDVEDAARGATVLRAVGVRQNGELLDGLDAADDSVRARGGAPQRVHDVGSVQKVIVLRCACAVHGDLRAFTRQDVALVAARLRHARLQENELRVVAPVQGEVLDLTAADQLADGRSLCVGGEPLLASLDQDVLGDACGVERDVHQRLLADGELGCNFRRLKPLVAGGHLVAADWQVREGVPALFVALSLPREIGRGVAGRDFDCGDDGPRGVFGRAGQVRRVLGQCRGSERHEQEREQRGDENTKGHLSHGNLQRAKKLPGLRSRST